VAGERGGDPGAVAFDALESARAHRSDVLIVDTAGRLHTRQPLMQELRKVKRVLEKAAGRPPDEVLLVLDATTGQNGIAQARAFTEAVEVTGVVLAKMDGTARGGIVLAVREELGVPVKLVGTGEQAGDLAPFDPGSFARRLVS
jgi:fused signal recognition particle receptor